MKKSRVLLDEIGKNIKELNNDQDCRILDSLLIYIGLYEIPKFFDRKLTKNDYFVRFLQSYGYIGKGIHELILNKIKKSKKNVDLGNRPVIVLHNFKESIFDENLEPIFKDDFFKSFQKLIVSSNEVKVDGCDRYSFIDQVSVFRRFRWFVLRFRLNAKTIIKKLDVDYDFFDILHLSALLNWLFFYYLPSLESIQKAVDKISKDTTILFSICADHADPKGRLLNRYFHQKGIPVYIVQQGLTSLHYLDWYDCVATKIFCISDYQRKLIVSQGVASDSTEVTGAVWQDFIDGPHDSKKNSILFGSQPFLPGAFSSRDQMFRAITSVFETLSEVRKDLPPSIEKIALKLHPSESKDDYRWLEKRYPDIHIYGPDVSISDLFTETALYITFTSQTTIQAVIRNIPVLNLAYDYLGIGADIYTDFVGHPLQRLVRTPLDLKGSILKMIEQPKNFDSFENKSVEKAVDSIRSALITDNQNYFRDLRL